MSEAAQRKHDALHHWAEPGSRHDRVVAAANWGLPVLAVAVGVGLAVAPFEHKREVSFILDKKKVDEANERMWVESARYRGEDNLGRGFAITANRAIQPSSEQPLVLIQGMAARLDLASGPLNIAANRGRYDLDKQQVAVVGPVRVAGPDGYRLDTRDVVVDLKTRQIASSGPVEGAMKLGQFQANRLSADLGSRSVALTGGARLKIVQGAVR